MNKQDEKNSQYIKGYEFNSQQLQHVQKELLKKDEHIDKFK